MDHAVDKVELRVRCVVASVAKEEQKTENGALAGLAGVGTD